MGTPSAVAHHKRQQTEVHSPAPFSKLEPLDERTLRQYKNVLRIDNDVETIPLNRLPNLVELPNNNIVERDENNTFIEISTNSNEQLKKNIVKRLLYNIKSCIFWCFMFILVLKNNIFTTLAIVILVTKFNIFKVFYLLDLLIFDTVIIGTKILIKANTHMQIREYYLYIISIIMHIVLLIWLCFIGNLNKDSYLYLGMIVNHILDIIILIILNILILIKNRQQIYILYKKIRK